MQSTFASSLFRHHRFGYRWRFSDFLFPAISVVVALAFLPLASLLLSWRDIQLDIWQHLLKTQLMRLIKDTLVLIGGVAVGVTVLGTSLAAVVVLYEFPGRRWLEWGLMLPFAIPAYVLAFVYLGIFDFSGPLQHWLRMNVDGFVWVDIRTTTGLTGILTLVFYPYVYMLARGAFIRQGRSIYESSRLLGMNGWQAFFRVSLPVARPAIIAGTTLAVMETLADFGTVSVFNYNTFTTAIYKTWFGLFNLNAAAQLATVQLVFVIFLLLLERQLKGPVSHGQNERQGVMPRSQLTGSRAGMASLFCLVIFALAFVLPVAQLLVWTWGEVPQVVNPHYGALLMHSLLLAGMAALLTCVVAGLVVLSRTFWPGFLSRLAEQVGMLGYAMPGTLLAVAIMMLFSFLDRQLIAVAQQWFDVHVQQIFLGGLWALLLAYMIRFLAVALKPVSASFDRVRPAMHEAARTLGHTPVSIARRVYLPLTLPGLMTALLLVFVDVLKEMPATLLMRPFGWDTLAVRIHEMTAEGEWERAALPAVSLVVIGLIPVVFLIRRSRSKTRLH